MKCYQNCVIGLFAIASVPALGCGGENECDFDGSSPFRIEAENYDRAGAGVRRESKSSASKGEVMHIGSDNDVPNDGIGDSASYFFHTCGGGQPYSVDIRYADDRGGNAFDVFVDGARIGSIETETTGGWNSFSTYPYSLSDDSELMNGAHVLRLTMTRGGSWGTIFDYFEIRPVTVIDLSDDEHD